MSLKTLFNSVPFWFNMNMILFLELQTTLLFRRLFCQSISSCFKIFFFWYVLQSVFSQYICSSRLINHREYSRGIMDGVLHYSWECGLWSSSLDLNTERFTPKCDSEQPFVMFASVSSFLKWGCWSYSNRVGNIKVFGLVLSSW